MWCNLENNFAKKKFCAKVSGRLGLLLKKSFFGLICCLVGRKVEMKRARIFAVAVLGFTLLPTMTRADTIWFDNVELGNLSRWLSVTGNISAVNSTTSAFTGEYGIRILGPNDLDMLVNEESTIGFTNVSLSFDYKQTGLDPGDIVSIQISDDGMNWQNLMVVDSTTASGWHSTILDFPPEFDNNPDIFFRVLPQQSSSGDRTDWDNFILTGVVPEPGALTLTLLGILLSSLRLRRR